jgi:hypothetical protein
MAGLNDYAYFMYKTFSTGTALPVDLVSGDTLAVTAGTINTGTINTGTIDVLKAGTISTLGTLPNLPGGSIVVTNGTIASVGGTVTTQGAFATGLGTIACSVAGSAGTIANTYSGVSRGITIVTPALDDSGTATLYLLDSLGGTMISQAQNESGTTYYGTVVPMTTSMNWISMYNATQSATTQLTFAVHYEK